jgi:hypothetical protein
MGEGDGSACKQLFWIPFTYECLVEIGSKEKSPKCKILSDRLTDR